MAHTIEMGEDGIARAAFINSEAEAIRWLKE
jgi:hypothetical protein